jgi:hypothetical protein
MTKTPSHSRDRSRVGVSLYEGFTDPPSVGRFYLSILTICGSKCARMPIDLPLKRINHALFSNANGE